MTMTFEPGPANPQPMAVNLFSTPNDPTAVLDGLPLTKMTVLRQRALDLRSQVPPFEDVQEASLVKQGHANRIAELLRPRSENGFGQPEDVGVVQAERRKLERATAELKRVTTLKEVRTARWNNAAQLERACTDWLLHGGVPGGTVLEAVEDAPLTELLNKGERIADAVERYRLRLRELAADLHRVQSAPWPSSVAKAAAKSQIDAIAEAAAPDCDRCIEHGLPVGFATMLQTAMVRNVDAPGAAVINEQTDVLGLMCWLFRDQILQKITETLDEIADDDEALSQAQREEMSAQITGDSLICERSECALIWHADASGDVIDFRSATSPLAVLGLSLRTATPSDFSPGSSPQHAYDLVGLQRRR